LQDGTAVVNLSGAVTLPLPGLQSEL